MRQRTSWAPAVLLVLAACGTKDTGRPAAAQARSHRPEGDADVLGREIFEKVLAVASGEKTKSEVNDVGEEEFAPWHIGPTL